MNTAGYDTIIVGGGLVGAAIACGLASKGRRVLVLDGGDDDLRASRGNFGLIWVQGKGADCAAYARWSGFAARSWPRFAAELQDETGFDIGLHQTGGYDFCLDESEWQARSEEMRKVREHTQGEFEYEMLANDELRRRIPEVSPDVLGASYSDQDGHVNPTFLLRALHRRMLDLGVEYLAHRRVHSCQPSGSGFELRTAQEIYRAGQVVFCAGLDNHRLSMELDMSVPLHPIRGQLLITERVEPFLPCATLQVRQTNVGTLQIGDSHEDVGLDDSTTLDVIEQLARRAVRIFPHLAKVNLIRAWGALRVMTPDGLPIYQQSAEYPGAFAISCHSGVTLAALHAGEVADWIGGESAHPLITEFSTERFE